MEFISGVHMYQTKIEFPIKKTLSKLKLSEEIKKDEIKALLFFPSVLNKIILRVTEINDCARQITKDDNILLKVGYKKDKVYLEYYTYYTSKYDDVTTKLVRIIQNNIEKIMDGVVIS